MLIARNTGQPLGKGSHTHETTLLENLPGALRPFYPGSRRLDPRSAASRQRTNPGDIDNADGTSDHDDEWERRDRGQSGFCRKGSLDGIRSPARVACTQATPSIRRLRTPTWPGEDTRPEDRRRQSRADAAARLPAYESADQERRAL